jgi:hypothetical protein
MGTEAVLALMEATPTSQPVVIALSGNQTVRVPLMHCVEKTLAVAQAMDAKKFKEAQELRGRSFKVNLETYIRLSKLRPKLLANKQVFSSLHCFKFYDQLEYSYFLFLFHNINIGYFFEKKPDIIVIPVGLNVLKYIAR